ncbi:MAG: tetratricopeptide repeat protein [Limnochordia bacterium]|nr:tetratricopeptide repeat protein [Bacillota bacterium]
MRTRIVWSLLLLLSLSAIVLAQGEPSHLYLGLAYYFQGVERDSEALKSLALLELERAVKKEPEAVEPRLALAMALHSWGRYQEAVEHYKALIRATGEAELRVLLGDALLAQDRLLEAYNQYDQALTEAEDLSRAHFGSGVILERWGRTEEALRRYEKVQELTPDLTANSIRLGRLLLEGGETERAASVLEEAARYNESPEVFYELACTYYAAGDPNKAQQAAQRVMQLAPNHSGAAALLDKISPQ